MGPMLRALITLLLISQTACNTVRGFGEDVEAAGDAVGDIAEETEEEIED